MITHVKQPDGESNAANDVQPHLHQQAKQGTGVGSERSAVGMRRQCAVFTSGCTCGKRHPTAHTRTQSIPLTYRTHVTRRHLYIQKSKHTLENTAPLRRHAVPHASCIGRRSITPALAPHQPPLHPSAAAAGERFKLCPQLTTRLRPRYGYHTTQARLPPRPERPPATHTTSRDHPLLRLRLLAPFSRATRTAFTRHTQSLLR